MAQKVGVLHGNEEENWVNFLKSEAGCIALRQKWIKFVLPIRLEGMEA